jgi:Lon protease-like protein
MCSIERTLPERGGHVNQENLRRICEALPIFPLPRVVLMPGGSLPLHVFEPRYQALIEHCLSSHQMLGVATLKPGFQDEYEGAPDIHVDMGVGRIVAHQPMPDGRCNVLLDYVGAVRVASELELPHPFRTVVAAPIRRTDVASSEVLGRLKMLVLQVGALSAEASREAEQLVALDGPEMTHSLARKLLQLPDERRAYLALVRLADQVDIVSDRLSTYLTIGRATDAEA